MDKYEFNIKVEQIKKLVNKGDYETAMKIADTIDWRRVRSTSLLTMVAQVYERNAEYQDAKDILLLAFERAPIGKGLLFKLTDLALREKNVQEAEAYYREFCDLAGDDPRQYLLRFLILEAKEAPIDQQINTLERYCHEELDEKWLYHLAELYQSAGREEDCIRICDKIMLLFGLGKYVDKAMELKLQYAPLTKYQMDLVENREKYEEKLRAVEEEYKNGTYRRDLETDEEEYLDSEDDEPEQESSREELEVSLHEAKAEEELAKEMSRLTPYDEEEAASANATRVFNPARDSHHEMEETSVEEDLDAPDLSEREAFEDELPEEEVSEDALAAREAAAAGEEETKIEELEEEEETIVEDWDLEPEEEDSNHLMIEAEAPEQGLALALESLKKIHREQGTKNPVAKISGEKLNRKGIPSVADRLAGKDLVVESAADLDRITVDELIDLMEQDKTGMIVVLIDTPARMEQMHNRYPALASKFQYIGCQDSAGKAEEDPEMAREKELLRIEAEKEAEAARQRLAEREEEIRRQAARDAEARRRQAELEEAARRRAELEAEANARRQAEYEAEAARRQAEDEAANAARYQAELEADEAIYQEEYRADEEYRRSEEEMYSRDEYDEEEDARRQARYEEDGEDTGEYGENYADEYAPEDEAEDDGSEMDVEEFAQYACKYASEIDCSITGKSLLALYERVEMMEEDGVPLTKANAEELIEEAADKAEKKSFGGLFSSKYDKEGLLILKEKHFFD